MQREQYIKDRIKEKGVTIKEFAKQIDIPYTTLLSMLNGSLGGASVDKVIKICKNLGISVEDLENNFDKGEPQASKELQEAMDIFANLNPKLQTYALQQIKGLLEVQNNTEKRDI